MPLVDARDPSDPLAVVGHDLARIDLPDTGSTPGALGRVLVADQYGNQSYAFDLTEERRRAPGGAVGGRLADAPVRWQGADLGRRPRLVRRRGRLGGPRAPAAPAATSSRRCSRRLPLDAGVPGTVWHRLLLDARIPPGCRVSAQSRSADEVGDLDEAPWRDEPAFDYQRTQGSELAFEADEVTAAGWATWEVLLQHGVGRHLQLRIELSGDVRDTPWLRALRVYYPRFSYVDRYLPAVYQADDESASFLTRFLANTEGILTDIEGRIVAAQALFDPRTAPESALDWLFGWFDLAADPTWDAARRRLFLRHATAFLGLRGTELGIVTALRLALDDCLDDALFDPLRDRAGRLPASWSASRPARPRCPATCSPRIGRWGSSARAGTLRRVVTTSSPGGARRPATRTRTSPSREGDQQWASFVERVLAVEPLVAVTDDEWQEFLRQRHGRIEDLNAAYGLVAPTTYPAFEAIAAPRSLPADGAPLVDWYHFAAVVAPARRGAHQFTVLLPVRRASGPGADARAAPGDRDPGRGAAEAGPHDLRHPVLLVRVPGRLRASWARTPRSSSAAGTRSSTERGARP